jgi:hypothetical protein
MEVDQRAERQSAGQVCVTVQEHVHTRPGKQLVQLDAAPGGHDGSVGQPVPGAGPAAAARHFLGR